MFSEVFERLIRMCACESIAWSLVEGNLNKGLTYELAAIKAVYDLERDRS